ncbi:hypothetical protein ACFL4V_01565 [Candidatus Latescibacterota bacterium]
MTGFAFAAFAEQSNSTVDSSGKSVFQTSRNPYVNLRSMSLLDPERFTMRQQTIMSYSSSGRGGSNLQGMYINTMEYRFKMPLTMRLRVAYQNNMSGLFGNSGSYGEKYGLETGRLYVPSFDLIYQPWKNTVISFHYRDFSGADPNYNNYYNRYRLFR